MLQVPTRDSNGKLVVTKHFVDTIVEGDSSQDLQMALILLERVVHFVHENFPTRRKIVLQSDNGSAFCSSAIILWISARNAYWRKLGLPTVEKYSFSEPQRGKTGLDAHFSFVAFKLTQFVKFGGKLLAAKDVYDGVNSGSGIANTSTAVLKLNRASSHLSTFVKATKKDSVCAASYIAIPIFYYFFGLK